MERRGAPQPERSETGRWRTRHFALTAPRVRGLMCTTCGPHPRVRAVPEGPTVTTPLLILVLLGGSPGQQPPDGPPIDTKAEAEDANSGAKKLVGEFVVRLDGSSNKALRL